jgi:hypothetical protein
MSVGTTTANPIDLTHHFTVTVSPSRPIGYIKIRVDLEELRRREFRRELRRILES